MLIALLLIVGGILLLVFGRFAHADTAGILLIIAGLILIVLAYTGPLDLDDNDRGAVLLVPLLARLPSLR